MISFLSVLLCCTERSSSTEVDRFATEPQGVIAELRVMDELARLDVVMELIEQYPDKASELCPLLSGDARKRCVSISERPHLWSEKKEETPPLSRSDAVQTNCQKGTQFRFCLEEEVKQSIRKGKIDHIKGLCANIEDEKWFSECLFTAAEQATRHRGAHGYAEGVELCMEAGSFSGNCQEHLIMMLAKNAPSAHVETMTEWAPIQSASSAVRAAWSWRDREKMELFQERLWSEAIGVAYTGIKPVTGEPFDVLSTEFHPHVRSALARRLLQIDAPQTHKLSTWVELAQKCAKKRAGSKRSRDIESRFQAAPDLWESSIQEYNIAYMATSRRLVSEDVEIDFTIAVLEAAARIPPAHIPLLEEGSIHEHPLVQQTAKRLLKQIQE